MSQRHSDVTVQEDGSGRATGSDRDHAVDPCALTEVIERVSGKWAIGIIVALAQGPTRFTALEREVNGISRRMLTLTLRHLERDGIVERTVFPVVPPKVEYRLSPMAGALYTHLAGMTRWAEEHRGAVAEARHRYDAARAEE